VGAYWPGSMSRAGQSLNIVVMIIRLLYIYAIGLNSFLKSILCILEKKIVFHCLCDTSVIYDTLLGEKKMGEKPLSGTMDKEHVSQMFQMSQVS
jgi:hypothetical protein